MSRKTDQKMDGWMDYINGPVYLNRPLISSSSLVSICLPLWLPLPHTNPLTHYHNYTYSSQAAYKFHYLTNIQTESQLTQTLQPPYLQLLTLADRTNEQQASQATLPSIQTVCVSIWRRACQRNTWHTVQPENHAKTVSTIPNTKFHTRGKGIIDTDGIIDRLQLLQEVTLKPHIFIMKLHVWFKDESPHLD